jgi:hypothetical protein
MHQALDPSLGGKKGKICFNSDMYVGIYLGNLLVGLTPRGLACGAHNTNNYAASYSKITPYVECVVIFNGSCSEICNFLQQHIKAQTEF